MSDQHHQTDLEAAQRIAPYITPATIGAASLAGTNLFAGRNTFSNGLLSMVCDAKFGPPTGGSPVTGDLFLDHGYALWSRASGSWVQITDAVPTTWTGGGANDITATGNWNGSALLNGYRAIEVVAGLSKSWEYNSTVAKWLGSPQTMAFGPGATQVPTTTGGGLLGVALPPWAASGWYLQALYLAEYTQTTADASNYWTLAMMDVGGTTLASASFKAPAYQYAQPTISPNVETGAFCYINATKTGGPGSLNAVYATLGVRACR